MGMAAIPFEPIPPGLMSGIDLRDCLFAPLKLLRSKQTVVVGIRTIVSIFKAQGYLKPLLTTNGSAALEITSTG